jgi:hypothetical protein
MNARLAIIHPQNLKPEDLAEPPLAPYLVLEQKRGIFLSRLEWGKRLDAASLEDVTGEDIRKALRLKEETPIYITSVHALPSDDLMSAEFLSQAQVWWKETVVELLRQEPAGVAS